MESNSLTFQLVKAVKICMVKRFSTLEKSWLSCQHWLPLSLTDSLTNCNLVNLFDVALAREDANSILVEVVTVADEHRIGNSLLQIWKLKFGQYFADV